MSETKAGPMTAEQFYNSAPSRLIVVGDVGKYLFEFAEQYAAYRLAAEKEAAALPTFSCVKCFAQCTNHDRCASCGCDPDTGLEVSLGSSSVPVCCGVEMWAKGVSAMRGAGWICSKCGREQEL